MGTDIHIHLEYRSRKTKRYNYGGKIHGERNYHLFGVILGDNGLANGEALFPARGVPGDVTQATLKDYRAWDGDAHHASWLSTIEVSACIVEAYIRMNSIELLQINKKYEDLCNLLNIVFFKYEKQVEDSLLTYKDLLRLMLSYEDDKEVCRIVFWFDN